MMNNLYLFLFTAFYSKPSQILLVTTYKFKLQINQTIEIAN